MELMLPTIEAFAHYIRGAITFFFVFWCFKLHVYKRRSRMMRLLYYATLYLMLSHLKDAVFLYAGWKNSYVLNDFVRTIDMVFLPLICAFFIEGTSPGRVSMRLLSGVVALQASFIVAFAIYPCVGVVMASMAFGYSLAVATIIYVLIFSSKYQMFIATNYSYRENIDVKWITVSCIVYFISLFFYSFAFDETTWLSESLYNVFSIVLWTFLFMFARRHRVVKALKPVEKSEEQRVEVVVEKETPAVRNTSCRDEIFETRLKQVVEDGKLYLNPKVSLNDVALAVGSNRTYLSDYFNNSLNTTFYDYMNTFRISKACELIDKMPQKGKLSMAVVASMSGFNSLSTFNRYFFKSMGISPKNYSLSLMENNKKNQQQGDLS